MLVLPKLVAELTPGGKDAVVGRVGLGDPLDIVGDLVGLTGETEELDASVADVEEDTGAGVTLPEVVSRLDSDDATDEVLGAADEEFCQGKLILADDEIILGDSGLVILAELLLSVGTGVVSEETRPLLSEVEAVL